MLKTLLLTTFFLFIAITQTSLAGIQLYGATQCQYSPVTPDIVLVRLTDASYKPRPYIGVSFSVEPGAPAAFTYPVTYTDEQGWAATILSFTRIPDKNYILYQAQDLSTGEIAVANTTLQIFPICEYPIFSFDPITAVVGNPYIATGINKGKATVATYTPYSTDPRIVAPIRGDIAQGTDFNQKITLEINPLQAGEAHIIVPRAFGVPITVQAANVNAPVVISTPITLTSVLADYEYDVNATSPLNLPLNYSLTQSPMGMTINPETGVITWPTTYGDGGEYVIKVSVSDGVLSIYQHYFLQVDRGSYSCNVDSNRDRVCDVMASDINIVVPTNQDSNWTPVVTNLNNYPMSCYILSTPQNGSASVAGNCSSGTYRSNPGFIGTDSFSYIAYGTGSRSNPGIVTVAVTEPLPTDPCLAQYPVTQFSHTGKDGTLSITLTGNITSHTNKEVKVCPGTTLSYQSTSTRGPVLCKIKNNTTRGSGTLRIKDHLKCTDKPAGQDKVHFKVKSGVK